MPAHKEILKDILLGQKENDSSYKKEKIYEEEEQ